MYILDHVWFFFSSFNSTIHKQIIVQLLLIVSCLKISIIGFIFLFLFPLPLGLIFQPVLNAFVLLCSNSQYSIGYYISFAVCKMHKMHKVFRMNDGNLKKLHGFSILAWFCSFCIWRKCFEGGKNMESMMVISRNQIRSFYCDFWYVYVIALEQNLFKKLFWSAQLMIPIERSIEWAKTNKMNS